jgi:hypothetical protein
MFEINYHINELQTYKSTLIENIPFDIYKGFHMRKIKENGNIHQYENNIITKATSLWVDTSMIRHRMTLDVWNVFANAIKTLLKKN